jgi:putative sporulation protein YyaC
MRLSELLDSRIPLFACIGSSKHLLDSYAPKVGSELKKLGYDVIGTFEEPLHAKNIKDIYEKQIKSIDKEKYQVIAIDLSINSKPGEVKVRKGFVLPGKGVGKKLPSVGEIAIVYNPFEKPLTDSFEIFVKFFNPNPALLKNIDEAVKNTVDLIVEALKEVKEDAESA